MHPSFPGSAFPKWRFFGQEKTVTKMVSFFAKGLEVSVVGAEILFFDFVPSTWKGFSFCTSPCKSKSAKHMSRRHWAQTEHRPVFSHLFFVHRLIISLFESLCLHQQISTGIKSRTCTLLGAPIQITCYTQASCPPHFLVFALHPFFVETSSTAICY